MIQPTLLRRNLPLSVVETSPHMLFSLPDDLPLNSEPYLRVGDLLLDAARGVLTKKPSTHKFSQRFSNLHFWDDSFPEKLLDHRFQCIRKDLSYNLA
uniref:Uncharacterized protein n=1 Tax=Physcomitrium patens TaxID=3218 RepID=A0A2K1ICS5_PHYPA|nr:hypothetical protein PHYPA_030563 [Physcomitrium patens]